MARRTKEEAKATRERLLDAAQELFRKRGVTRTSLAHVATAAGMTRGAVYWHFRDKADLFRAMCERATLPLDASFDRAVKRSDGDALATLRELSIGALQNLATDTRTQHVFDIMFLKSELVDELAGLATTHRQERRACLHQIELMVRRAVREGRLAADLDAGLAAQALHAYMVGIMHEWVLDPAAYDLAEAAPGFIDLFLGGLMARPPRRTPRRAARTVSTAMEKSA
jgi:TetR/AcrR family acrAB operon transcriptional repressor